MRLLIIGSLDGQIGTASKIAMSRGAKVAHVADIGAALEALRSGRGAELVMVDVKLDIRALIEGLAAEHINVPVVACGVATDASAAVRAIKAGAKEYIPLPPEPELIAAVLEAATEESHAFIFRDSAIKDLISLADQVAPSAASILITGESGTGKEVLARYVHRASRRADQPLISVNCAAIPENLLESELFGHEKGAFTGAIARRIGKFEEAHRGTLLLDEISEMDTRLQAKLLRALQEQEIDRVGGNKPVKVDIRLIATSNHDLHKAIAEGKFREDLLYRINVVDLHIPPLRERCDDIPPLAEHFIAKYAQANGIDHRPLSPAAMQVLRTAHWRGNVRELENCLHRAVLLAKGNEIGPEAFQIAPVSAEAGGQGNGDLEPGTAGMVGRTVADVERDLILETLQHCLGNRTHAANILGISIRTLRNKLKLYSGRGIAVTAPREVENSLAS